jgi:RNA polymerase sigma-70 factor (ECF subfamily)
LATTDAVLLEQARTYSTQALAEIYDRYSEAIYRYLYRYLGDAELAEDLTSEVFLRLLRALNTRREPRDRLQGWLYRVARNLAMDWFRQQAKATTVSLHEELVADGDAPLAEVEKNQAHRRLRQAIYQLTPSQQQVIFLRFGEGLSIAEVGRLMGKSEGAIKLLQYRAVRRLRKLLEREEKPGEKERSRTVRGGVAASSARREHRGGAKAPGRDSSASLDPRRATTSATLPPVPWSATVARRGESAPRQED